MPRPRTRIPLDVYLNGRLVGQLRRDAGGAIDFKYAREWLAWEHAIPVSLSLPLREQRYIGAPVVAVFDNLLPDDDDVRRRIAERSSARGTDAYSLLAAIGRDCVGALQFMAEGEGVVSPGVPEARRISEAEVADVLANLERNPLGIDEEHGFRISLAGAQEKTALLYWKKRWHVPRGTTPTTHILKPQIGRLPNGLDLSDSVENEHFCLRLVGAFGLPVAQSQIVDFAGRRALAVERFDRLWTQDKRLLRVPQEDCCQALSVPPSRKYETSGGPSMASIARLLKGSDTPALDARLFFKTQVLFWLLGATDGHAKNFSIRLSPGGRFVLTPVYDVLSVQPNFDAGRIRRTQMRLAMAVGTSRHYRLDEITPRHFLQTAKLCDIPETTATTVLDEIAETADAAMDKALSSMPDGFPGKLAASIIDGARARLKTFGQDKRRC
jgi:serine/threonine-protein kinase HipA